MSVLDKFLDAIKLNDDYDEDDFYDDFDDDLLDEEEEVKPRKSFFNKFKGSKRDDDLDDYLDQEEPPVKTRTRATAKTAATAAKVAPPKQPRPSKSAPRNSNNKSSKITPMRDSKRAGGVAMEVCVIKPVSMEDTREIADTLIDNCTVVLNLEGVDVDLAQRIIDFTSGSCYSLNGSLQKISSYIFIITPYNVDVSGDFQNILGDATPSIRTTL